MESLGKGFGPHINTLRGHGGRPFVQAHCLQAPLSLRTGKSRKPTRGGWKLVPVEEVKP